MSIPEEAEAEVDVLSEDQEKINRFSCLNQRNREVTAEIFRKKENLQSWKDAQDEAAMIMEADALMFKIGDSFVPVTEEQANESLGRGIAQMEAAIQALETQSATMTAEMSSLKSILYAKFGSRINLEP
eukprot:GHVU01224456.1.p2 GENE.GHVU01224456.1~~GHVU01224456.1.p2  ORF type:complete len:150 (+),score=30.14 GHVU01224456.1:66-452(+)